MFILAYPTVIRCWTVLKGSEITTLAAWWRCSLSRCSARIDGRRNEGGGSKGGRNHNLPTFPQQSDTEALSSRAPWSETSRNLFILTRLVEPGGGKTPEISPGPGLFAVDSCGRLRAGTAEGDISYFQQISGSGEPGRWVQSLRFLPSFWALWFQPWPDTLR